MTDRTMVARGGTPQVGVRHSRFFDLARSGASLSRADAAPIGRAG